MGYLAGTVRVYYKVPEHNEMKYMPSADPQSWACSNEIEMTLMWNTWIVLKFSPQFFSFVQDNLHHGHKPPLHQMGPEDDWKG